MAEREMRLLEEEVEEARAHLSACLAESRRLAERVEELEAGYNRVHVQCQQERAELPLSITLERESAIYVREMIARIEGALKDDPW